MYHIKPSRNTASFRGLRYHPYGEPVATPHFLIVPTPRHIDAVVMREEMTMESLPEFELTNSPRRPRLSIQLFNEPISPIFLDISQRLLTPQEIFTTHNDISSPASAA